MQKQRTRSSIDDKYKWDLTKIYKTNDDFYKDLDVLKDKIEEFSKYETNVFESKETLESYLNLEDEVDSLFNKLFTYAYRHHDEDTTVATYQKMVQEIDDVSNNYSLKTSFFLPLLYKTDEEVIKSYLNEESLKKYQRYFSELFRFKDHVLDQKGEEMLSLMSNALTASDSSYTSLTDADMTFPSIKDESGNLVELTESNFTTFIRSQDRRVRKDAFDTLFSTYAKYKNTITSIYSGHINSDVAVTKARGYSSTIERYLYPDKIDISVYDNLIKSVSERDDVINNYFSTIKNVLGLDELHRYDIYTSLISDYDKEYSYEDAKKLVLNALSILGDDYTSKLKEAFDNSWIDVYNNKGKRGGAYSAGTYDTVPYVLLNYENKLTDVSTLAHELGHSMHSYYSKLNNDRIYANYKIFVAEVASTTNELLLNHYLLENSTDNLEKLTILDNLMSLYYATIVRQTMFAEFEKEVYSARENNQALTHEFLEDKYYNLCKKYFKDHVVVDDLIKYEWERIPHFYYGFYVYKYATSLAASTVIADKIINEAGFVDKYIKFLSSGGSMDPLDELKIMDIDLSKKEVIDKAMDKFNEYITEFSKIYQEVKRK